MITLHSPPFGCRFDPVFFFYRSALASVRRERVWASGPAAAARPVEAGLGPARDGWPPTSALALLVKMAAVAIAATKVQSYSAQAPVVFRLLSHFAHARAARPASLREGMSLPRFDPAAKSCSLEPRPTLPSRPQLSSSPENWCLICCLPADAAGEPGGPLYYKEALTRFYLEFFYPLRLGTRM